MAMPVSIATDRPVVSNEGPVSPVLHPLNNNGISWRDNGHSRLPPEGNTPSSLRSISSSVSVERRRSLSRGRCVSLRVLLLDGSTPRFDVPVKCLGKDFLELVYDEIGLLESDYFGLQYAADYTGSVYWLDPEKQVVKQVKCPTSILFRFAVKFYTPDPGQLQDEYTKYLFALQIKRDLSCGLIPCGENTAALMASYMVQAELGDFSATTPQSLRYLNNFKFIPEQTDDFLEKVMNYYKDHTGQTPADADFNLLDISRRLEMYGVRLHPVRDYEGVLLHLTVSHSGILIYQQMTRINQFNWAKIRKLSFKKKYFIVKLHHESLAFYKDQVEFLMSSRNACKRFWKDCIEHHSFFRLPENRPRPKRRLFTSGSNFRYSGRTQKEVVAKVREATLDRSLRRTPTLSSRILSRSLGARPTTTPLNLEVFGGSIPSVVDNTSRKPMDLGAAVQDSRYSSMPDGDHGTLPPPPLPPVTSRQLAGDDDDDFANHDYVNFPLPYDVQRLLLEEEQRDNGGAGMKERPPQAAISPVLSPRRPLSPGHSPPRLAISPPRVCVTPRGTLSHQGGYPPSPRQGGYPPSPRQNFPPGVAAFISPSPVMFPGNGYGGILLPGYPLFGQSSSSLHSAASSMSYTLPPSRTGTPNGSLLAAALENYHRGGGGQLVYGNGAAINPLYGNILSPTSSLCRQTRFYRDSETLTDVSSLSRVEPSRVSGPLTVANVAALSADSAAPDRRPSQAVSLADRSDTSSSSGSSLPDLSDIPVLGDSQFVQSQLATPDHIDDRVAPVSAPLRFNFLLPNSDFYSELSDTEGLLSETNDAMLQSSQDEGSAVIDDKEEVTFPEEDVLDQLELLGLRGDTETIDSVNECSDSEDGDHLDVSLDPVPPNAMHASDSIQSGCLYPQYISNPQLEGDSGTYLSCQDLESLDILNQLGSFDVTAPTASLNDEYDSDLSESEN